MRCHAASCSERTLQNARRILDSTTMILAMASAAPNYESAPHDVTLRNGPLRNGRTSPKCGHITLANSDTTLRQ